MSVARGLKVLQPQLPAQIDVGQAKKKLTTVVLTGQDFTPEETAFPGLSVTVNLSVSFAKRKKMIALIEAHDKPGVFEEFHAIDEMIQLLKTVFLVNWNLVINGKPLPIEDIEELEDEYLSAVVKASFKALQQGASLDPNSAPS